MGHSVAILLLNASLIFSKKYDTNRIEADIRKEEAHAHQKVAEVVRELEPAYRKLLSAVNESAEELLAFNKWVKEKTGSETVAAGATLGALVGGSLLLWKTGKAVLSRDAASAASAIGAAGAASAATSCLKAT